MKFQQNYEIICQMVDCINSAFCWSHFATILSLFHVALADINWTYTHMYDDQSGFTNCNLSFRNHFPNEFKFFAFSDVVLWILHLVLIIYYIFQSGIRSQKLVMTSESKTHIHNSFCIANFFYFFQIKWIIFYLNDIEIDVNDKDTLIQVCSYDLSFK